MSEKKKSKWFPIAIVLILLAGVITSAVILIKPQIKKHYTVTFLDLNGDVLAKEGVKEGSPAYFNKKITVYPQKVFKGWNQDINKIESDMEVSPTYQDISNSDNVFFIDSVYIDSEEIFTVDLKVGGKISVESAKIGIAYDPKVLSFVNVKKEKYCSGYEKQKDGYLIFDLNFDDFSSGEALAHIEFKSLDVSSIKTDLPIDLMALEYNGGTPQSESISGFIYIY